VSEQRIEDQAEGLRELVQQKNQSIKEGGLSLPPRSEVHRKKPKKREKKKKWKLKYPLVRLLVLFFILLPISMLSIYYTNQDSKIVTVVTRSETGSYELVDIASGEKGTTESSGSTTAAQNRPGLKTKKTNKKETGQKVITHVVQENETLYSIAMKYYQSDRGMEIIKKWNHLQNTKLHQGQVLQIPVTDVKK
jgi:LysM repeat protein